jgi:hypothetical protein
MSTPLTFVVRRPRQRQQRDMENRENGVSCSGARRLWGRNRGLVREESCRTTASRKGSTSRTWREQRRAISATLELARPQRTISRRVLLTGRSVEGARLEIHHVCQTCLRHRTPANPKQRICLHAGAYAPSMSSTFSLPDRRSARRSDGRLPRSVAVSFVDRRWTRPSLYTNPTCRSLCQRR